MPKRPRLRTGAANIGAMGELIVAADLLKLGFEVFRSVSPTTSCDLLVMRENKMYRVEVTVGHRHGDGIRYDPHDKKNFDIIAVVFQDGDVIYMPSIHDIQ